MKRYLFPVMIALTFLLGGLLGCSSSLPATPTANLPPTQTLVIPTAVIPTDTIPASPTLAASATATIAPPTATVPPQPTDTIAPNPTISLIEFEYEELSSPSSLLASFYNAINRHEYERAYSYLGEAPSISFETFVQSYADVATIIPAVIPPTRLEGTAGSTYTQVATFLQVTKVDGSIQYQQGCYTLRYPHVGSGGGPPPGEWHIDRDEIGPSPHTGLDSTELAQLCELAPPSPAGPAYEDTTQPVNLLASLFDAVNRKDYQRAYAYWETLDTPFEQFAQGYADTEQVILVVFPTPRIGAAAGSVYAQVPTFLMATHQDGSTHAFLGCYVTRRSNVDVSGTPPDMSWHIYSAQVDPYPSPTLNIGDLMQVCPTP